MYDRLRSLPIPRGAVLLGRSLADTALVGWGLFVTVAVGFATGYRFHGSLLDAVAAVGLCLLFGFAWTWPFILMGLVAGSGQAANGMAMLAFPFVFVSSAYVPVESMPGWLQPVAEHQPVTPMIGAVRALSLGDEATAVLGHSAGWYAVRALAWCGRDRGRVRPAGDAEVRPALTRPASTGRRPRRSRAHAASSTASRLRRWMLSC